MNEFWMVYERDGGWEVVEGDTIYDFRGDTHTFRKLIRGYDQPGKSPLIETDKGVRYSTVFPTLDVQSRY